MDIQKQLFVTNKQKILYFLLAHPSQKYMEKEITEGTEVSRAGTNFALRELTKEKLVQKEKKGRMSFYSVDLNDSLIKQLKVLVNLTLLRHLLEKLKKVSQKIVVFGSFAQGTNVEESDIDLFVLSDKEKAISKIINNDSLAEKIQLVTKKPLDFISLKQKDPVFYEEVERGLVIWGKTGE